MNIESWTGYKVKNALMIILDDKPKILWAWFLKDKKDYWNRGRQTEAHITICSQVPDHIQQLWTEGTCTEDCKQSW